MALDFPSSPADNLVYPTNPTVPGVAYRAKSSRWLDVYGRADRLNRAINGAFQMSQINGLTDGTGVNGLYMADQFEMYFTSSDGVFRGQRVASPTPKGSPHRLRITINTANSALVANEYLGLATAFEGTHMADLNWGTAAALPLVVRFGFRGPAGTYSFSLRNHALDRSFTANWTISAGQANTDTEQIIVIPPCLDSTWNNNTTRWGVMYWFIASANTSSTLNQWRTGNFGAGTGITNNFNTAGNVFELFDVGVYRDPNFTGLPPEWELPEFLTEYRRCLRYWCKIWNLRGTVGTATLAARCGVRSRCRCGSSPPCLYGARQGCWTDRSG